MERRAREPEELEDLFRIDHLTTRMRRHAESLIILSGDAPARAWRQPVPFVDVLRAAVAEVEDYTRIKVTANTRAAITGPAVADVIHMVAELAENAVVFSPPNTPVLISGDVVGRGFAVEIEDRGLGLSDERRAELNDLLESPPPFDLSGSDQLGLFVASQLARSTTSGSPCAARPTAGRPRSCSSRTPWSSPRRATSRTGRTRAPACSCPAGTRPGMIRTASPPSPGPRPVPRRPPATAQSRRRRPQWRKPRRSTPGERWPASAERWPADSGADPWTAPRTGHSTGTSAASGTGYAAGEDWTTADPVISWDGNGVGAAAESGNGLNGLAGYGDDVGWPPAADPVHADSPAYPEPDAGDFADADSLPRRVRQASLAPQLRENTLPGRPAANGDPATTPETVAERSPEEARSTITAIQQGWERGRSLFDPPEKSTDRMTGPQSPAEPSPRSLGRPALRAMSDGKGE